MHVGRHGSVEIRGAARAALATAASVYSPAARRSERMSARLRAGPRAGDADGTPEPFASSAARGGVAPYSGAAAASALFGNVTHAAARSGVHIDRYGNVTIPRRQY